MGHRAVSYCGRLKCNAVTAAAALAVCAASVPVATRQLEIATSVSMLEGPTVDREGNVYFTDILMQRIMRFSKDGVFSVFREKSNVANRLVIDQQGRLIAAEGSTSRRIVGCAVIAVDEQLQARGVESGAEKREQAEGDERERSSWHVRGG